MKLFFRFANNANCKHAQQIKLNVDIEMERQLKNASSCIIIKFRKLFLPHSPVFGNKANDGLRVVVHRGYDIN